MPVVEAEGVFCGRKGMQFYCRRPVSAHERMLEVKFRALRQDFRQLFERVGYKLRLTVVMTGKWMSPLDDPVVVGNVREECAFIGFKGVENILDLLNS